jgi:hypothetical protein
LPFASTTHMPHEVPAVQQSALDRHPPPFLYTQYNPVGPLQQAGVTGAQMPPPGQSESRWHPAAMHADAL